MVLFALETRAKASSLRPLAHPLPRSIQYIYTFFWVTSYLKKHNFGLSSTEILEGLVQEEPVYYYFSIPLIKC